VSLFSALWKTALIFDIMLDAFRGFSAYSKVHGEEQALKIINDERLVLERVDQFVKKHNVPCDFNLTTTFDVCMTPEFAAYEAESLEAFRQAGGDTSHIKFYEGEQAQQKTRVPGAVAAYEWPAGSSHPAKLTQFLLQTVISKGAKLFTFCPATEVTRSTSDLALWDVHTPRGTITAEKIIHCTNAHAAQLLPLLEPYMRPNRAQAHSLVPVPAFSGAKGLQSTFSLRYSLHHFYSLIQRQGDGTLVLGVSRSNPTLSAETIASRLSTDDSRYNEGIVDDALRTFGHIFPDYKTETAMHGEGLDHAWTGIIGMTTDSVPFVGGIDSLPGQYICAGFNGHGKFAGSDENMLGINMEQVWHGYSIVPRPSLNLCLGNLGTRLGFLNASISARRDFCDFQAEICLQFGDTIRKFHSLCIEYSLQIHNRCVAMLDWPSSVCSFLPDTDIWQ
jgi:glycine/D-amino acid oxidase-like deaminating enzyme